MVLPITVNTNGTFSPPCGGPFKSGTSFYVVMFDSTVKNYDTFEVWKADSDDPSSGWTAQDTSNGPTGTKTLRVYHAVLDGTTLHIVTQAIGTTSSDIEYHSFNCSTNTWSVTNESVTTAPDTVQELCSIGVRSDGDVIVAYAGEQQSNMGTGYDRVDLARRESGTWTADISVDNLGKTTTHMRWPFMVMSANNRAHIFYHDTTGNDLHYSTYLSGNTWGHQHTEPDATTAPAVKDTQSVRAIRFDDGGTEKIRAYYKDASNDASVVGFDDADSPGASISIATDISDNVLGTHAYAVDGAVQHMLYEADSGGNIYHDETGDGNDTWGTDETEITAGGLTDVFSANVYDNSGTVLAYLYQDGSLYRYNERSLGGATTYAGLAAFAGDGSLAGDGVAIRAGTAAYAGDGSFAATGQQLLRYEGLAAFAGDGSFAGIGHKIQPGVATFAGDGSFAATGAVITVYAGTATFAGDGAFVGNGVAIRAGTATYAGDGEFNAVGIRLIQGTATFAGDGSLAGVGQQLLRYEGLAAFAGDGSLTGIGARIQPGVGTFAGDGSFSATGTVIKVYSGVGAFAGDGVFTATGQHIHPGTANFAGDGSLAAIGQQLFRFEAVAAFAGDGSLAGVGSIIYAGVATYAGDGTFVGNGNALRPGIAAYAGDGSFSGAGTVLTLHEGIAAFAGDGVFAALGGAVRAGAASYFGDGEFFAGIGNTTRAAVGTFAGDGVFVGNGTFISGATTWPGVGAYVGDGIFVATGSLYRPGVGAYAGDGAFTSGVGRVIRGGIGNYAGDGVFNASGSTQRAALANFVGDGAFHANGLYLPAGVVPDVDQIHIKGATTWPNKLMLIQ